MKTTLTLLATCFIIILFSSCKKDDVLKGDQSPMGEVGTTVDIGSAGASGVSDITGTVTALEDGVSVFSATATVTNTALLSLLSNFPEFTINGNTVSTTDLKFKMTTEGVEAINVLDPGILFKYDSEVGDTYPIGSTSKVREVVSKSTDDDFYWGWLAIKVIEVEEYPNKYGIKKITYYGNHKWGFVGFRMTFDDDSVAYFSLFSSTNN